MLKLYQIATTIASPLIHFYLVKRRARGKEDPMRFHERFGHASLARPEGKLAWIHAASVGESISILPLITVFSEKFPEFKFLVTTGTVTSAKMMESRLPKNSIHQYIPVDIFSCVKRFLRHWQPDIAIFVESEIWPNLITQTAKTCPLFMVNGRMSADSFKKWEKNQDFAKLVFGSFSLCLMQSRIDADYLQKLGASNVKYSGNIKYDAPPLPSDSAKLADLSAMIGNRPLWVAASTHKGEEEIIAAAHSKLKANYPDILTIIVPRHPTRKDEIITELSSQNLQVAVRSSGNKITENTDIYLADTLGELGIFYSIAKIVFVGGSLVKSGGHNPLEPAHLGSAIIVGPHTFNFAEIMAEFTAKNAIIIAQNSDSLANEVASLLANPEKTSQFINAALGLVKEKTGVIKEVVSEISPYIENKNAA